MPISNHVITDTGRARVNAGTSFMSGATAGAVASQSAFIALWNPVGNAKSLFVKRVKVSAGGAASPVRLCSNTVVFGAVFAPGKNKLIGGAAPTAEVRSNVNAAIPADPILGYLMAQLNTPIEFVFNDPIKVLPGFGIYAILEVGNNAAYGAFEWDEV